VVPARPRRWPWIAAALGVVIAAPIAWWVTRSESVPAPAATTPRAAPIAKKLFAVPLRTGLGLSPSGTYLTLNSDRLQIRDTNTGEEWSTLLGGAIGEEVSHLELDDTTVRFGSRSHRTIMTWKFRSQPAPTIERELPGSWFGTLTTGELAYDLQKQELYLVDASSAITRTWKITPKLEDVVVSPSRERFAYVQPGRFRGHLVVGSAASDELVRSAEMESPTSVALVSDAEVLFATGTVEQPRILRMPFTASGFGTATEVYAIDTGWFGPMRMHGSRLYFVQMQPAPRTTLVERTNNSKSSRDLDNASVSLGWTSPTEYWSWSRTTERLERRSMATTIELSKTKLDGEPANATMAGEILIAAVRRPGAREAIAVSRVDGHQLWRHQDGRTFGVRCAEDLRAPCFAIRVPVSKDSFDREDEVFTLVPETGELGAKPIYRGAVQDLAVHASGQRIVVVGDSTRVVEIDPTGKELARYEIPVTTIRSVAYDPRGGFIVGVTHARNTYQVGRYADGVYSVISQSEDAILSLVRPSTDGDRVLIVARFYAPEVWQLTFPQ